MQRVNETALSHLHGLLDEVVNGIDSAVFLVEDLRNEEQGTFYSFSVQCTDRYCTPKRS